MATEATGTTRAFLSHSWTDKALARRIARRLSHRGVPVWVDENEMQIGTVLSERLAAEIAGSSHFLVLSTQAAAQSRWVAQEIEVARAHRRIVILPLIAEEGVQTGLLDLALGISIADPWTFEDRLDTVASAILRSAARKDRDFDLLKKHLGEIGREAPELRGLIEQLANTGQLTIAQLESLVLDEPLRHPAETALIALHEGAGADARYVVSLVAATCFLRLGVGYEVLRRQIAVEPPGSSHLDAMFHYLGRTINRTHDISGARRLFDLASLPMDQHFADFVRNNFTKFSQSDQEWAVRFMTTPDRGPAGFAVDAAFELFSRLPDNSSLRALWHFWINDYKFGGKPGVKETQEARLFFYLMNEADKAGLKQFDAVMDSFEYSFRRLVRSRNVTQVLRSVGLIHHAAETRYIRRNGLASELSGSVHSAEWKEFAYGDILQKPMSRLAYAVSRDEQYDLDLLDAAIEKIPREEIVSDD